ncbi:MAG: hypothetical protein V4621_08245 [Pseudomonadota bacterium]
MTQKEIDRARLKLEWWILLRNLLAVVAIFSTIWAVTQSIERTNKAELAREFRIIQERDSLARERYRAEHARPYFSRYQWHYADEEE